MSGSNDITKLSGLVLKMKFNSEGLRMVKAVAIACQLPGTVKAVAIACQLPGTVKAVAIACQLPGTVKAVAKACQLP